MNATVIIEDYDCKKLEVLNVVASNIVALSKMKKTAQVIAIMKGTGSAYLAERWDGDFAARYLNSDSKNQPLWLKMLGVENPSHKHCYALHQAMLFFCNNPLTRCFKEESLLRMKLNIYGNGVNWCKLWLRLDSAGKDHVIKFF